MNRDPVPHTFDSWASSRTPRERRELPMVGAARIRSQLPVGFLLSVLAAMFAIVLWTTVTAGPSAVTTPAIGFAEAIAHMQALNQEKPVVAASDLAQSAGANRALNAAITSRLVHDALEESASVNRALNQENPAVPTSDLAESAGANQALNAAITSRLVLDALEESASVNRALNQP